MKKTTLLLIMFALSAAGSYLQNIYLINMVGMEDFGRFVTLTIIVQFVVILQRRGWMNLLVREIGKIDKLREKIIILSMGIMKITFNTHKTIAVLLLLVLAYRVDEIDIVAKLIYCSGFFPLSMIMVYSGYLKGDGRLIYSSIITSGYVALLSIALSILTGVNNIEEYLILQGIVTWLMLIILIRKDRTLSTAFKIWKHARRRNSYIHDKSASAMMKSNVITAIGPLGFVAVLKLTHGLEVIGSFRIAQQLIGMSTSILSVLSTRYASELLKNIDNLMEFRRMMQRILVESSLLSIPALVAGIIYINFMNLDLRNPVYIIALLGMTINMLTGITAQVINFNDQENLVLRVVKWVALIQITVALSLIYFRIDFVVESYFAIQILQYVSFVYYYKRIMKEVGV